MSEVLSDSQHLSEFSQMIYDFTFRIVPPRVFGLSDPDYTVFSSQEISSSYSHTMDTVTGNIVGRGTQTRARLDDDRITVEFSYTEARFSLVDDFMSVSFEAVNDATAEELANQHAADFCALLSHVTMTPCRYEFVQALDATKRRVPTIHTKSLGRIHSYNLDSLRGDLASFSSALPRLQDQRLRASLVYFQKALLLRELFGDPRVERYPSLIGASTLGQEAFLNFWKAIASILGEASDGKRFQTFYKKLGYSRDDFVGRIRPLYHVRDDYDVAHSSLDPSKELFDHNHVGVCLNVSKQVIDRYISYLNGGN